MAKLALRAMNLPVRCTRRTKLADSGCIGLVEAESRPMGTSGAPSRLGGDRLLGSLAGRAYLAGIANLEAKTARFKSWGEPRRSISVGAEPGVPGTGQIRSWGEKSVGQLRLPDLRFRDVLRVGSRDVRPDDVNDLARVVGQL